MGMRIQILFPLIPISLLHWGCWKPLIYQIPKILSDIQSTWTLFSSTLLSGPLSLSIHSSHLTPHTETDRHTHTYIHRETERDTDRQTDRHRHLISLTDSGSNFSNSGSLTTLLAANTSGHWGGVRQHVLTLEKGLPAWDLLRCLLRGPSMNWAAQLSGPLLLASFLLLKKPYDRRDTPLTQPRWGNRTKRPWNEWWQSFADTPWLRRLRQSIQISQGFDAIPTTKHLPDSSSSFSFLQLFYPFHICLCR